MYRIFNTLFHCIFNTKFCTEVGIKNLGICIGLVGGQLIPGLDDLPPIIANQIGNRIKNVFIGRPGLYMPFRDADGNKINNTGRVDNF